MFEGAVLRRAGEDAVTRVRRARSGGDGHGADWRLRRRRQRQGF